MGSMEKQRSWERVEDAGVPGEPAGSPGTPASSAGRLRPVPNPEVEPKAKRRQFSASYKLGIIREAEACKGQGEIGALLRREGLYASQLCTWRKAHRKGALGAPRGRKPNPDAEQQKQMARLERENERLRRKLQQAEAIIEVQKKVSEILGISLATPTPVDEES